MATKTSTQEKALNGALLPKHKAAGLYLAREQTLDGDVVILKCGKEEVHRWLAPNATYIDIWNKADWWILKTQGEVMDG